MNIRSIARKPFYDLFFQMSLVDGLAFNPNNNLGGAGAHYKFSKFKKSKINQGLGKNFNTIQEIQEDGNHITSTLSCADLLQLGGAAAVEYCGGPFINIKVGRLDISDEALTPNENFFPNTEWTAEEIRSNYSRLGLNDEEVVALFGYRTLGFLSNKGEQENKRWTRNPYVFDNNYFVELLDGNSPYVKTESDMALINDESFRKFVEQFANDQPAFFEKFASTFEKISEINQKDLMIEC